MSTKDEGTTREAYARWQPEPSWGVGAALIAPGLALIVLGFVWPLGRLVSVSLQGHSLDAYRALFESTGDTRAFIRTLSTSAIVTLAAVAIGAFLAWEMRTGGKTRRRLVTVCVLFPLWTSVVVRNYALTIVLQRRGILNDILVSLGLVNQPVEFLYRTPAVAIGMLYTLLPYATLPLYATFINIDMDLVRAARSLGAGPARAARSVVVPLAILSIVATGALVFVLSLGFYVTPIILGSAQEPFVANRIATDVFVLFDLPRASAAGVVLLMIALACLGLTWRAVGFNRIQRTLG